MKRTRILNGILLLFVIWFYIFSDSYISLLLLVITMMLLIVSSFIPVVVKSKIDIAIDSSHSFYKHEKGSFDLHIQNKSILPMTKLKCTIQIHNILTEEQTDEVFYTALNGKSKITAPFDLTSDSIGKIHIKVVRFTIYDFFGNVHLNQHLNEQSELFILPNPHHMNFLQDNIVLTSSENDIDLSEEKGINAYDIIGFKEYEVGDHFKQIHWKISSKIDDLIVKEMSTPKEQSYFILLETSLKEYEPKEMSMLIEAFYSVSKSLLHHHQAHSLGWFDHQMNHVQVRNISSLEQLNNSLREMLEIPFKEFSSVSLTSFLKSNHYLTTSHLFYIKAAEVDSVINLHDMHVTTIEYLSNKGIFQMSTDGQSTVLLSDRLEEIL